MPDEETQTREAKAPKAPAAKAKPEEEYVAPDPLPDDDNERLEHYSNTESGQQWVAEEGDRNDAAQAQADASAAEAEQQQAEQQEAKEAQAKARQEAAQEQPQQ